MIEIIIPLAPVTKKNSQVPVKVKGRLIILPSPQYRKYEKECGRYIKPPIEPIKEPVNVKCLYYMPTRRRVDLSNLIEASHDVLVKYKVLEDDNSKIIVSVDGSRVYYDKHNPRTEVYITRAETEDHEE